MLERVVDEAHLKERITRLRGEAFALCSEVRDLEHLLPWPPEHRCIDCEVGRLERGATDFVDSEGQRW